MNVTIKIKNTNFTQLIYSASKTLLSLFLFILGGLFFDSYAFVKANSNGQTYASIAMITVFIYLFVKATGRSKELMIYALLIGIAGECLFSLVFEMYTYRLGNVPLYVPPGHAIIYIVAVYFCREAAVKFYRKQLEISLLIFIIAYALFFLLFLKDIFGFVLTLLIIFLLRNKPRERLFFYVMYLVVVVLELIGTSYKCWVWPNTAFGIIPFLKSANPPSGISFFYFGLDLASLWLYKQRHKMAWNRMKTIRILAKK